MPSKNIKTIMTKGHYSLL